MPQKNESIKEMYERKNAHLPLNYERQIGHFNFFEFHFNNTDTPQAPHGRRDYYKIMLVKGRSLFYYADRTIEIQQKALSFASPQIPYTCKFLSVEMVGCYCIFDTHFFHNFGTIKDYEVFQPQGKPIFELTDEQFETVEKVFKRMSEELNSNYIHKHDALRNLVFEILHFALKTQPSIASKPPIGNAAQRITTLFLELLERQFPVDELHPRVLSRSASDFATQMNIHVNHLNHALQETLQKTTSEAIAERIIQEAKILLKHSSYNISEVAYALNFNEVAHFNNFFKKHTGISPTQFRKS